jgi:hypothetical protein
MSNGNTSSIKTLTLKESYSRADQTWASYFTRNASQKLNDYRRAVVPLHNTSMFLILETLYEEIWRRMPFLPTNYSTYFYRSVPKQFGFIFRTSYMYTYLHTCVVYTYTRTQAHSTSAEHKNVWGYYTPQRMWYSYVQANVGTYFNAATILSILFLWFTWKTKYDDGTNLYANTLWIQILSPSSCTIFGPWFSILADEF